MRLLGHPKRVLLAALAFFAVGVVFGAPVAGLLSTNDEFSDPGSESVAADERLEEAIGSEATPGVVLLVRPASGGADVARRLERVDGVGRVVRGPTSRDRRSTYVAATVARGVDDDDVADRVHEAFDRDRGVLVGGSSVAFDDVGDQVSEDLTKAELLAFPILFLLSLWVFRGLIAALLPLFVGALTIVGTFLALRITNEIQPLSIFALNLATGLGLGLAIDYSLFVVSRYREELARGLEPAQAIAVTMRTAGRTVTFSSLTVAAALLALLVFPQRFLYSMGLAGAFTALMAMAVSLTALPALLLVLGRRVGGVKAEPAETGFWYRLSRSVMRRPLVVALTTGTVLIIVGLPFLRIEFVGVDARLLPSDAPAHIVDEALRTDFPRGATEPVTVAVEGEAGEVEAYARRLSELEGAAGAQPPRRLRDGSWQVDVIPAAPAIDERSQRLVDRIRAEQAPGTRLVGGVSATFTDQQEAIADRLPLALAILAATTLLLLFVMTGSVVLPLKSIVMNVLSLSAAFGILVLIFQDGRLEDLLAYESTGGLDSTQPLVLLCVVFGLSTDYAVFLLARIKEAHDAGMPTQEAVARGLQRTGRIITAAALLFTVAIGAFATSEIVFLKQVGVGTAVAVLIDATIVRALLVPALMELLDEWNWWAPAPLRRLHERLPLASAHG